MVDPLRRDCGRAGDRLRSDSLALAGVAYGVKTESLPQATHFPPPHLGRAVCASCHADPASHLAKRGYRRLARHAQCWLWRRRSNVRIWRHEVTGHPVGMRSARLVKERPQAPDPRGWQTIHLASSASWSATPAAHRRPQRWPRHQTAGLAPRGTFLRTGFAAFTQYGGTPTGSHTHHCVRATRRAGDRRRHPSAHLIRPANFARKPLPRVLFRDYR